ncbi:Conserved TM helix [Carnobacterium alterfunditum]|uniref:Conserved TM helix n=1 Tax=Carnobacterium alterfunditum TaxID=28230 RepID=A0A1N6HLY9_9LACT|nr:mechanosensitive ion channel [Carnobacterium alterfunditum]SIO20782.1 Conserved TM helix [Carnobacterium alterfunditum]
MTDTVTNSVSSGLNSFVDFLPTLLGAILLLILAWVVATVVKKAVQKGLKVAGFGKLLTKWSVTNSQEQAETTIDSLSQVLYFLVWLLFLPGILGMLGLDAVARPISNMFDTALNFFPNMFAAVVIMAIGIIVARFVKNLVYNLALTLDVDKWVSKLTTSKSAVEAAPSAGQKSTMAKVLGNIVYIIILIPIVTIALETLNIQTISRPIVGVLNQVLAAIPNVIVAVILLAVGVAIAKFVGELLTDLLSSTGINNLTKLIKNSGNMNFDIAKIIGQIVAVVIGVFFTVEALNVLNLEVLNTIGSAMIAYLPLVISALIILGVGVVGGSVLGGFVTKSTGNKFAGESLKYILIVLSVFMALDQLKFATSIVNLAFILILGALSVAFAIAFGIGGRDFAKSQLAELDKKMDKESKSPNDQGPTL